MIPMSDRMKHITERGDTILLRAIQRQQAFTDIQKVVRKRDVAIFGSGPSIRDAEIEVEVSACIVLNRVWEHMRPVTVPLIGWTRDAVQPVYDDLDPCDFYIMGNQAHDIEQTDIHRTVIWPEPLPLRPLGAQPIAVWIARLLGVRDIHLYGCDSVFGTSLNTYPEESRFSGERETYFNHPHRAVTVSGDCKLVWHLGDKTATKYDIPPHRLRLDRKAEREERRKKRAAREARLARKAAVKK